MKRLPVDEHIIYNQLNAIVQLADTKALLEVVKALAKQLGQHQIDGLALDTYFDKKRQDIADNLVENLADEFPTLAEQIKRAWKRVRREIEG